MGNKVGEFGGAGGEECSGGKGLARQCGSGKMGVSGENSQERFNSILVKAGFQPLVGVTKMAKINYSFEKRQKEIAKKKKKEEKLREKQLAKDSSQSGASPETEAQGGEGSADGGAPAQEGGAHEGSA
jgi:hypothetical protein